MSITAGQVKELRDRTGAGMMDAKKALEESQGDMDKAAEILRQKGIATAEKKSGRVAAEGAVASVIAPDKRTGVLVEVNCETDFVGKGDQFQAMVSTIGQYLLDKAPADVDALMALPSPSGAGTVKDYMTEQIAQIKENLTVRRFVRYGLTQAGTIQSYIHMGGKIGVLLQVSAGNPATLEKPEVAQMVKDITLQIASAAPEFVSRTEIPQSVIDEETRVEMGKEDIQNKPVDIRAKIVDGRVSKLLGQRVLLEQPFIKDPNLTIEALVQSVAKAAGDTLAIDAFTRYALGEGIEKKEANFAEEVAAAAAGV
jgi:elongation factor Ts